MKKRIVCASTDFALIDDLARRYDVIVVGQASAYDGALTLTMQTQPDAVIIADNLLPAFHGSGVDFTSALRALAERVSRVVVLSHLSLANIPSNAQCVLMSGDHPSTTLHPPNPLAGTPLMGTGGGGQVTSLTECVASALGLERAMLYGSRLIAFYSGRGGVGKSTLALNLATLLSARAPTLLADLDIRGGSTRYLLGYDRHVLSLREWAEQKVVSQNGVALSAFLQKRGNLSLLLAPSGIDWDSRAFTAELFTHLLRVMRLDYAYVLVDLGIDIVNSFVPLTAMKEADLVLFVTSAMPASVATALEHVPVLADLGVKSKTRLVASQLRAGQEIHETARRIGLPLVGQVPFDEAVIAAEARGEPVVMHNRRASATKAIEQLADAVLHEVSG